MMLQLQFVCQRVQLKDEAVAGDGGGPAGQAFGRWSPLITVLRWQ